MSMALASPQQRLEDFLQLLPFPVDELPPEACLVGGAVRDALLQRQSDYVDFDFVVPEQAVEIAQNLSQRHQAGFVVLDAARHIARVVFPQGTLDFAQQEGESVTVDLYRRDYRINAIAYHIHSHKLIDPLNGLMDLEQRVVRMVTVENLAEDPLRLLRAYRQAAQLGFELDPETRVTIQKFAPLIRNIAAERVQHEVNYLLAHPDGDRWLALAHSDGLLAYWFPQADILSVKRVKSIVPIADQLAQDYTQFQTECRWLMLAKLACLVGSNVALAQRTINSLKYSRYELRTITLVLENLPKLLGISQQPLTLREQYFFFLNVKDSFPILVLLARALGLASDHLDSLLKRYFDPADQVAHPVPIVTGNDLIQQLNLRPSPQIGYLLTEIQIALIEGKVNSKQDALSFGRSLLNKK